MSETMSSYHQTKEQIDRDQALVREAKKDPARFGELYKKYHEQIFLFILKRVESEDTAADITSGVFLKALTHLSRYTDMGLPFSSWLFRIARNEVYNLYYQQKIEMVVSLERKGMQDMIAEMQTEQKRDDSDLMAALEQLAPDEMEVIELRFFEKRPFKEVGEILAITENNAKVRTYRVLDKLKKLMQHER